MSVKPAMMGQIGAARATHHEVEVLGHTTHYWTYPAKGKSKGTLVLLHGYRGAHDGLEPIIGGLEDFDCIAPDLPGYGITEPLDKKHNLATYSEWLGEFLMALKLPVKPAVLGHSFATLVMSHHTSKNDDMGDLIMLNPVAKPGLKGPRRYTSLLTEGIFWAASKLPERGARYIMDHWLLIQVTSSVMCKTRDKALRKWVHGQHHKTLKDYANATVMFECYQASISHSVEEFASAIENRTLMIAGAEDDITSEKQQREVAPLLANSTLAVLPGVGHLTHYETTEEVCILIRDFLSEAKS